MLQIMNVEWYLFKLQIEMLNEYHWQFVCGHVLAEIRNPGFQDQLS